MIFGVAFEPTGRYVAFTGWNYYGNTDGHAPTPVEVWDFAAARNYTRYPLLASACDPRSAPMADCSPSVVRGPPFRSGTVPPASSCARWKRKETRRSAPMDDSWQSRGPRQSRCTTSPAAGSCDASLRVLVACGSAPTENCSREAQPAQSSCSQPPRAKNSPASRTPRAIRWTFSSPSSVPRSPLTPTASAW